MYSLLLTYQRIYHRFLHTEADSAEQLWPPCTSKHERKSRDHNSAFITPSDVIKRGYDKTQFQPEYWPFLLPCNTGTPMEDWRGRVSVQNGRQPSAHEQCKSQQSSTWNPAGLKGVVYQRVSKLTDTEEQIYQLNLKGYQASKKCRQLPTIH